MGVDPLISPAHRHVRAEIFKMALGDKKLSTLDLPVHVLS